MAIKIELSQKSFEKARKDAGKDKDKKFGADFCKILGKVEKALADEKKSKGGDGSVIEAAMSAIEEAAEEAERLSKDCDPKQDKEFIGALKKLMGECDAEQERLEEALQNADGDEDDSEGPLDAETEALMKELLNPGCFSRYLKNAKKADTPEEGAGFCFAFHKKAEQCKLTMLNPSKAKKEYMGLKRGLPKLKDKEGNKLGYTKKWMIYGTACRDTENKKMLVLACDPSSKLPNIPGMDKKLKLWGKANRAILKGMKRMRVIGPGGEVLLDDEVPDNEYIPEDLDNEAVHVATATPNDAAVGDPHAPAEAATGAPPQAPPGPNGATPDAAAMEDRRKLFRTARQEWQVCLDDTKQNLEKIKDCIRDYFLDSPAEFNHACKQLGQLDAIMNNLGEDLRDVCDKYVSTPKTRQEQLQQLASEATAIVERNLSYVKSDPLLSAIDSEQDMGLADMKVREPLEKALRNLVKTLG